MDDLARWDDDGGAPAPARRPATIREWAEQHGHDLRLTSQSRFEVIFSEWEAELVHDALTPGPVDFWRPGTVVHIAGPVDIDWSPELARKMWDRPFVTLADLSGQRVIIPLLAEDVTAITPEGLHFAIRPCPPARQTEPHGARAEPLGLRFERQPLMPGWPTRATALTPRIDP